MSTFTTAGNQLKITNTGRPASVEGMSFPYDPNTRAVGWVNGSPQGWYDRLAAGTYQQMEYAEFTKQLNSAGDGEAMLHYHKITNDYIIVDGWPYNNPLMLEKITRYVPFPDQWVNVYDTFKRGRKFIDRVYVGNTGTTFDSSTAAPYATVMVNGVCWYQSGENRWFTPHEYFNYDGSPDSSDAVAPGKADGYTITAHNRTQTYTTPYIWDQRSTGQYVSAGTVSATNGNHGIIAYDDMIWGRTAEGTWFTNHEIYQSGAGDEGNLMAHTGALVKFPVLAYHDFTETAAETNDFRMTFSEFEKQLDWLDQLGYTIISMDQAYEMLRTNTNNLGKVAVLTFDDGYDSWDKVADILKARGLTGTFFLAESNLGTTVLNAAKKLVSYGSNIGNHTFKHIAIGTAEYWNQWYAWNKNKSALAQLGVEVKYCAYPEGDYNYLSPMAVKNNNYTACFAYNNRLATAFSSDFGQFTIGRLKMNTNRFDDTISQFQSYLQNGGNA